MKSKFKNFGKRAVSLLLGVVTALSLTGTAGEDTPVEEAHSHSIEEFINNPLDQAGIRVETLSLKRAQTQPSKIAEPSKIADVLETFDKIDDLIEKDPMYAERIQNAFSNFSNSVTTSSDKPIFEIPGEKENEDVFDPVANLYENEDTLYPEIERFPTTADGLLRDPERHFCVFTAWHPINDNFEQQECTCGRKRVREHTLVNNPQQIESNYNGTHTVSDIQFCMTCGHEIIQPTVTDCNYGDIVEYNQNYEYRYCKDCGDRKVTQHNLKSERHNDGSITYTCQNENCDYERTDKPSHGNTSNNHNHNRPEHDHYYIIVDSDHNLEYKKCSCGSVTTALHYMNEGELNPDGSTTYSCQNEGCRYQFTIDPIHQHQFEIVGHDNTFEHLECECGEKTTALHNMDNGTTNGDISIKYKCQNPGCDYEYDHDHKYTVIDFDKENENIGCECGYTLTRSHKMVEGEAKEDGTIPYTCENEGCKYSFEIKPHEHKFIFDHYEGDLEHLLCECGNTTTRGHKLNEGVLNPDGSTTVSCENEGCEYNYDIPAHKHFFVTYKTDDEFEYKICHCKEEIKVRHDLSEKRNPNGTITYTCNHEDCNYSRTTTVTPPHRHSYRIYDSDEKYEYKECSSCGNKIQTQHDWDETKKSYNLHSDDAEYCYDITMPCKNCDKTNVENYVHNMDNGTTNTASGDIVYKCQNEGCTYTDIIKHTDHVWDDNISYNKPSEVAGYCYDEVKHCKKCNATEIISYKHQLKDEGEVHSCQNKGCGYTSNHTFGYVDYDANWEYYKCQAEGCEATEKRDHDLKMHSCQNPGCGYTSNHEWDEENISYNWHPTKDEVCFETIIFCKICNEPKVTEHEHSYTITENSTGTKYKCDECDFEKIEYKKTSESDLSTDENQQESDRDVYNETYVQNPNDKGATPNMSKNDYEKALEENQKNSQLAENATNMSDFSLRRAKRFY
ncbi:MAG: hypothetical protein K2M17_06005 [Bacilli bacterium]|nr:hypothetical protein [Bacilli bacterium]